MSLLCRLLRKCDCACHASRFTARTLLLRLSWVSSVPSSPLIRSLLSPCATLCVLQAELNIYMYPSRIYKILNVLEPFSYASYLVFVCESNALLPCLNTTADR